MTSRNHVVYNYLTRVYELINTFHYSLKVSDWGPLADSNLWTCSMVNQSLRSRPRQPCGWPLGRGYPRYPCWHTRGQMRVDPEAWVWRRVPSCWRQWAGINQTDRVRTTANGIVRWDECEILWINPFVTIAFTSCNNQFALGIKFLESQGMEVRRKGYVLLYTPLFSRTVIFAVLARCGNSRVVNFAILLMLSLL